MREPVGIVHGRFQLFHNDHLKFVLAAKERCKHLLVGICNPDQSLTAYTPANPHRSSLQANPFTYFERYQMIQGALLAAGLSADEFDIVPFPINYPELIPNYVPMDARFYLTIYDRWGREKEEKLCAMGCDVEVLWEVDPADKGLSGSDIRRLIRCGDDWAPYVPGFVYRYVTEKGIDKRIRGEN